MGCPDRSVGVSTAERPDSATLTFGRGLAVTAGMSRILCVLALACLGPLAHADEDDVPATCLHLLTAEDGLVSMGTKDLFRLHGGTWERLV